MKRARFGISWAWKGRQVVASGGAALLVGLAIHGCAIGKPQVPSTDWTLRIPVADERTTIFEVVEDHAEFLWINNQDNSTSLKINTEIDNRQEIGDRLKVKPQRPDRFETPIGDIEIPGRDISAIPISLRTMLGDAEFARIKGLGIAVAIPATGIDQTSDLPLEDVESLIIRTGGIDVNIDNGLPVDLDLHLVLIDRARGDREVAALPVGVVPAGSIAHGAFIMDGADISGNLGIVVRGTTVAADNVLIEGEPGVVIQTRRRDMAVEQAVARIPPQTFSDNRVISFPDDRIKIEFAQISQGGLSLSVQHDIPLVAQITLRLDDLEDASGNPVEFRIDELRPGEVVLHRFNLDLTDFAPLDPLEMRLSYEVLTADSERPVPINSGELVFIQVETEDLLFSRVNGILNGLELDVPSATKNVAFPEGLENIALKTTSLDVYLTSAVDFQSDIELFIKGSNKAGESLDFTMKKRFERGDPADPQPMVVTPDSDVLTDFLNLLPNTIEVTPKVLVGDGVSTGQITPDDWVRVDSVVFNSAAKFQIKADDRIEVDPKFRELEDEEARTRISNNLKSARAITLIENHIPLAVWVSLRVAATKEEVYTNPLLRIPTDGSSFGVEAAPVDPVTGRTTGSIVAQPQTIELTKDEVLVFLRDGGGYTGVLVEFDGTDGFVELLGSDWVNVQAATEVVIELNESLVKWEKNNESSPRQAAGYRIGSQ